jgi:hypothetical protein
MASMAAVILAFRMARSLRTRSSERWPISERIVVCKEHDERGSAFRNEVEEWLIPPFRRYNEMKPEINATRRKQEREER